MQIIDSLKDFRQLRPSLSNRPVGFVPTMGALHEGHLALVRQCKQECPTTIVSIFVNPLQFGPKEDLQSYPRPIEQDITLLKNEGVDLLFMPKKEDIYPAGFSTHINEERFSNGLCGEFRPGHFQGVTTVVCKLFNIVRPHIAYFGQKDLQQFKVIEKMLADLNMAIRLSMVATVREKDGLAMSSRNVYLNPIDRRLAANLYKALIMLKENAENGERSAITLAGLSKSWLEKNSPFHVQYLELRHIDDWTPVETLPVPSSNRKVVVAIAAYLGKTRLIDNIII